MPNTACLRLHLTYRFPFVLFLLVLATGSRGLNAQLSSELPPLPQISAIETKDGMIAKIGDETLHLTVCSDSVIHVVAGPEAVSSAEQVKPWMLAPSESCPSAVFTFKSDGDVVAIETAALKISFSLKRGNLTYSAIGGEQLLQESDAVPRTYESDIVNGLNTYHVSDR